MTGAAASARAPRLVYLDALRAFCMFYGILSHGASLDHTGIPVLIAVRVVSDLFRMATFFLIAGFFTAMVASAATGGGAYVRGRVILILVPLATSLVTLVPITNYLIHVWHNGPMPLRTYFLAGGWNTASLGKDVWHLHLWFLFALFFYAMAAPALLALARRPAVQRGIDTYLAATRGWTLWMTAIAVALAVLAARAVYIFVAAPFTAGTRIDFIAAATLAYSPYFALGVAMYAHKGLFRSMHHISWTGLGLSVALYLVARYAGVDLPVAIDRLLLWVGKAGTIVFSMAALLRIFELRFNTPSRSLSFFVAGSFTFYLLHLTGIYVVSNLVGDAIGDTLVVFAIVVVVVPPAVLAIHKWVIAPVPALRFLYNGRLPGKPAPAAKRVQQGGAPIVPPEEPLTP